MSEPDDQGLLELSSPVQEPRRARVPLVVGAVVALLVALVLVVLPAGESSDVVVEETTPTTGGAQPTPDPGTFPAPIALGGATDGKDSVGLPVKAEPGAGLVDGQEVAVTGTGFPPGVSVGIVMCAREAGRDHGAQGVAACNIGHFRQVDSDADGVARGTFPVRRLLVLADREIDCASEPGRCMVAMGMVSDYDTSGGALVDFAPGAPLPDPPAVAVEPGAGLGDGDPVTVEVTGLTPNGLAHVHLCAGDETRCVDIGVTDEVGADGRARIRARVWRVFGAPVWEPDQGAANVDCAAQDCFVRVVGETPGGRLVPTVPVSFLAGDHVDRSPPPARVLSEGPFAAGDDVTVEILELPEHTEVELLLCAPGRGCAHAPTDVERDGEAVRVTLEVPTAAAGNPCSGDCSIVVNLHVPRDPATPPLLFPAPIPIEVTG